MDSQPIDLASVALQFEVATAKLRVLSQFPEAQRVRLVKGTVDDLKKQVGGIEEQLKKMGSEVQSLRDIATHREEQITRE